MTLDLHQINSNAKNVMKELALGASNQLNANLASEFGSIVAVMTTLTLCMSNYAKVVLSNQSFSSCLSHSLLVSVVGVAAVPL